MSWGKNKKSMQINKIDDQFLSSDLYLKDHFDQQEVQVPLVRYHFTIFLKPVLVLFQEPYKKKRSNALVAVIKWIIVFCAVFLFVPGSCQDSLTTESLSNSFSLKQF
jgi:hypothetical protein